MTEPNLAELRRGRAVGPRRQYEVAVAEARRAEKQSRANAAQGMARCALVALHHDDYRSLYRQALEQVNAERGPLPGDDA